LLTSKKLHLNIIKRLVKTYVRSVAFATYGSETWEINDIEKKKTIKAFEMWCWRRKERNKLDRAENE